MEFFSDEPTEKWTCSEVYNYYRNKNKDNKTLSEVLIKIREDLRYFSKKELKPVLRSADSGGGTCYIPFLNIKQLKWTRKRIEKIVSPMTKCINNLKTEFHIQTIKLYFCPENDDWDSKYDAVRDPFGSSTCKTNQPPIAPDTAEALETAVDI
ncbi:hypothetical protein C1645_832639 [Glomus cerebriforme]|uniref:Uncharacterized protein n=1 Tax=Glomus cerebriforme TaxID=658196 RepID=A0A397SD36_9GLOM|nr:hypothetical protein C1645_832639 [Glomus cerebriforme]